MISKDKERGDLLPDYGEVEFAEVYVLKNRFVPTTKHGKQVANLVASVASNLGIPPTKSEKVEVAAYYTYISLAKGVDRIGQTVFGVGNRIVKAAGVGKNNSSS